MRFKDWWALLTESWNAWSTEKVPRLGAALAYYTIFAGCLSCRAAHLIISRESQRIMDAINTSELIRRMPWSEAHAAELEMLLARAWLVTNGLGGYAAGTVSGILTRRYHGLLVVALPGPFGRMMLLPHLSEQLRLSDGTIVRLGGEERTGEAFQLYGASYFSEFRLEYGLPIWRYNVGGVVLEKQVMLPHAPNTVHVTYRLVSGAGTVR
jgi:hypothetical protein